MTEIAKYLCRNCGNRFEVPILTERERLEADREHKPVYAVQCPQCQSQNLKRI